MEKNDRLFDGERRYNCPNCGGLLKMIASGEYECTRCGRKEYDDFGVIKKYLEENGPRSKESIVLDTGVRPEIVDQFLREERLMVFKSAIQDGQFFCSSCGTRILFGTLCEDCRKKKEKEKGSGGATTGGSRHGRMHISRKK